VNGADASHGWCSLRLRFDEREQVLLKGAEHVRGAALASTPRPDVLRSALSLAKAARKLAHAGPASVSLEEPELRLLIEAVHFSISEVRWAARAPENDRSPRREAVLRGFPELVERGVWRGFGLSRELEELEVRLTSALSG
jgi:hypothetical protein